MRPILPRPSHIGLVSKVQGYLADEFARPRLRACDVAAKVGLSRRLLTRVLKQHTGLTFAEMLKQLRLARATELLQTTDLLIKEIAFSVGYTATANFDRDFKKAFGTTPAQVRSSSSSLKRGHLSV
jgi:two-component system, response regulator YesN